jgi:hypothetical protein
MWVAKAHGSLPSQQLRRQTRTDMLSGRLQALASKIALCTRTSVPCWKVQVDPTLKLATHVHKACTTSDCIDQLLSHDLQAWHQTRSRKWVHGSHWARGGLP